MTTTELQTTSRLNWEPHKDLGIGVYHTVSFPELAKRYYQGQKQVLSEFGVSGIASIKNNWWENHLTYMITVTDQKTGELGAGIRLDVVDDNHPLPIQEAIKHLSPDIVPRVHRYNHVMAEVCGLWIKKEFSERGLAHQLFTIATSIALKLRINLIVGLSNQYTTQLMQKCGYTIVTSIGENGRFPYPNENYTSTVLELDPVKLQTVCEADKQEIVALRKQPVQTKVTEVNGYTTRYFLDLRIH